VQAGIHDGIKGMKNVRNIGDYAFSNAFYDFNEFDLQTLVGPRVESIGLNAFALIKSSEDTLVFPETLKTLRQFVENQHSEAQIKHITLGGSGTLDTKEMHLLAVNYILAIQTRRKIHI